MSAVLLGLAEARPTVGSGGDISWVWQAEPECRTCCSNVATANEPVEDGVGSLRLVLAWLTGLRWMGEATQPS